MTSRPIEKISYDGEFFSSKEMKLRFADFNAGAHFSNDAVLTLITDAHSDYLISKGLSLDNVNGSSIIFTAVTVNFLKEIAFAQLSSNTSLIMKIGLYQVEKTRLYFYHENINTEGQACHKALLEVAFMDNKIGKVVPTDSFVALYQ